ncbi:MAG: uracil-DNA glycosylase [Alphaproteobacteria bacterium]
MEINSLHDLYLAGVKWELSNFAYPKKESKQENIEQKIVHNTKNIIKTIAPISMTAAQEIVCNATNFSELCNTITEFNHPLKMFAKNTILPTIGEKLLILTDSPSSEDDEFGQILSGVSGELLDKMLNAIGLERNLVSICPLLFWRTPGGRTPTDEELSLTKPFVDKFIELSNPTAVLTLGPLAAKYQFKNNPEFQIFSIPNPSYMILKPDSKKIAWDQLQKMLKSLE